ncbi:MAG: hypothetical protein MJ236_03935 [Clostridia bacterium]|nr:hypothetical protein [Clostridia bacterium]
MSLSFNIRNSNLAKVYNLKTDGGKGRFCMMAHGVAASIAGQLAGGVFYSGYLLAYGFSLTSISLLSIVPYLTTMLYLVAPSIVERFAKRKWLIAGLKIATHLLNILGITLLPILFPKDADGNIINITAMQVAFFILTFMANALTAIYNTGLSAWQANFLENDVRADYFTSSTCINALLTYIIVFALSLLTDSVKDTPNYLPVLTTMRFVALIFAAIDVILMLIPREYEYTNTVEKPNIKDVFTLPLKNKPFFLTILILALLTFSANIHAGYIDAFILNEIGIEFSLINGINALYFLFFILFGSMWKRFIAKLTWFRALGTTCIMEAFTYLLYSFIAPGRVVLYVIVRLSQHLLGVVRGTIQQAAPYINLPETDKTNYLAFNTIVINGTAFLSRAIGVAIYENVPSFSFIGINGNVPLLILLCSLFEFIVAIPCFTLYRKITPKDLLDEFDTRRAMKKAKKAEKNINSI